MIARLLIPLLLMACTQQGKGQPDDAAARDSVTLINADAPLDSLIRAAGVIKTAISIHVDKSDKRMSIKVGNTILKQYPVVLGGNPVDDKRMEGDECTPEGHFSIRDLYPHRSWSFFMWIDYPTAESWTKHKAAKQNGEIPAGASIGGEVGIHGVPEGRNDLVDENVDWTLGCISLKTEHIKELYAHSFKGMKVHIEP
jgi:murein L,D-transpeptidase YafK